MMTVLFALTILAIDATAAPASQKSFLARLLPSQRRVLEWEEGAPAAPIRVIVPALDDPDLAALRTTYGLDKVVAGADNDYERLRRLLKWVHDRWKHSGNNRPSKPDPLTILDEAAQGKRFRCVEYSVVLAGCAQALGMPARVLALKREDVETARSGAGHVVTEVWLKSRKKWVFADGQWDAIPEKAGEPINAVEFQEALAKNAPDLAIRSSSPINGSSYGLWVAPYLYYFDFNIDQDLFKAKRDPAQKHHEKAAGDKIMLVPKGAKKPTIFQRTSSIGKCTYISNPKAFYPAPTTNPSP